ncbi:DNA-directed primase/polymerase protein-like [Centruroides sculpturatus]|uniref:DNA-directed primase/polymerase protein-like n=1 Tax=Centruroides sculpturatus TaxID=218467 RepID=UPI000C6CEE0E|nr:DNA-directed primase/polymerase protein-like [Centruroides sculpturatus]
MNERSKDARVFGFEQRIPGNKGKRTYLVTHPKHLWQIHKKRPVEERCTYEVIVKDSPCKLYFDLEFNKTINPGKDGSEMVNIFIEYVCKSLKEKYNVYCDKSNVLQLDASDIKWNFISCLFFYHKSDLLFSLSTQTLAITSMSAMFILLHLIFVLNGFCFKNNIETGKFVNYVCLNIMNQISSENTSNNSLSSSDLLKLLIKGKDGKETLFCDLGVYSKNRNFRLYLSTKFHKNAPLILSEENKYKNFQNDTGDTEENIFLDSLITYFRLNEQMELLCWDEPVVKCINKIEEFYEDDFKMIVSSEHHHGFQHSPYPEVDSFIRNIVENNKTRPGYIRHWSYFPESERVLYDIGNYRYCENIGRHHKSNHIMFIACLKEGTYYQKCYDPECRSQQFRSKIRKLPPETLPAFFAQDTFVELNDIPEAEEKALLEAVLLLENSPEFKNILNDTG